MVKLLIISVFCVFVVNGTHHYEIIDVDNLDLHSREIYFDERYPIDQEQNKKSYIRPRRQVSGGVMVYPGGETRRIGYFGRPFWGSMSQTANSRGFTSPTSYRGGVNARSRIGNGISGSISAIPRVGGRTSARGQVNVLNTPAHQVTARAQRNRNFDKNFRVAVPERNSAGLRYNNAIDRASVSINGYHVPGRPNTGSISGSAPLATGNRGNTRLEAVGQTNFGHGTRSRHEVGLNLKYDF